MASFNGSNIFGRAVTMVSPPIPVERQENTFPGVNGVESLTMGTRGGVTEVSGLLVGATSADLKTAEDAFRTTYNNGQPYTLVDTFGTSWTDVLLESFSPAPRVRRDPTYGYCRAYSARFRHLI